MKKQHLIILLVVAAAAVGAAMYFNIGGKSGPLIAYSSVGDSNAWFVTFARDMEKESKKQGYAFRVTHAGKGGVRKQIADVQDMVALKPEFLVLGPCEPKGSAEALRIAKKAGVKVIVVNRDIEGKHGVDYVTKIYSDFDWIGEKMAEAIHGAFPAGTEKIRVVELHGTAGASNTVGMQKGFARKIAEYGNIEIVSSRAGNFNRTDAINAMESVVATKEKFDAVVCHFDTDAMAAIKVLTEAGIKVGGDPGKGEIIIVGNGGTKDGLNAVKAGKYHKIVSVSPYYANQVFDAIKAVKAGKTLPPYIQVKDVVIDKSNVDQHMATGF